MNRNQLYESMDHIPDKVLERSENRKNRSHRPWWFGAVAAALLIAVTIGVALRPGIMNSNSTFKTAAIKTAVYPEMAPFAEESQFVDSATGEFDSESYSEAWDAWWESYQAQRQEEGYADGLESFFTKSIPVFLAGKEGQNSAYSPLNVFMALGMLAEITDGNTRQQILDLLGSSDIESLRTQAKAVWNGQYQNDGVNTCILASSLWLRDDINYVESTLDTLADTYYASSFQGEMGSEQMNQALRDWLNQETGGLLEEQIGTLSLDSDTVIALATTLYFRAAWANQFSEGNTRPQTFHGPDGDVETDFMHASEMSGYYQGDAFTAVDWSLQNRGTIWFLLPEEGTSPEELLKDSQALEFLSESSYRESVEYYLINLALPKFDITSQTDLLEGLKTLGVADAMDWSISDFSPVTQDFKEVFLSQVQHGVRVAVDEEGVEGAAYTVMQADGASAAAEPEEVDFVLDRPFVFAITSQDGLPLFVGIVNQPG